MILIMLQSDPTDVHCWQERVMDLLIVVIAGGVILYQGSLGGKLVYDYGIGTALMPMATPMKRVPRQSSRPRFFRPCRQMPGHSSK